MFFSLKERLNGYRFPVYSTESCPKNEIEWLYRSSAINCTEWNGYMCMPNENLTMLLEFCYNHPILIIQRGKKKKQRNFKVFHHIDKNSIWLFKSYTCKKKKNLLVLLIFRSSFFLNIKCAIKCVLGSLSYFWLLFGFLDWYNCTALKMSNVYNVYLHVYIHNGVCSKRIIFAFGKKQKQKTKSKTVIPAFYGTFFSKS